MQQQRILLIDDTTDYQDVVSTVSASSHVLAGCYSDYLNLKSKIKNATPDLIMLALANVPSSFLFELKAALSQNPMPVVLFTDDNQEDSIQLAVQAGVTSYIFNGLDADRIDPIIQVAQLRFEQTQTLQGEIERVETQLNNRVLIDRAKGMLMDTQAMSEQQAYRALQKTAMDHSTSMVAIAKKTIQVLEQIQPNQNRQTA